MSDSPNWRFDPEEIRREAAREALAELVSIWVLLGVGVAVLAWEIMVLW